MQRAWTARDGSALGNAVVGALQVNSGSTISIDVGVDNEATIMNKLRVALVTGAPTVDGVDALLGSFPAFLHILAPVVVNAHRQFPRQVKTPLRLLKPSEASCIGQALSKSIFFRKTGDAAVSEWVGKYPALRELRRELVWFEPMMVVIAQHLMTNSMKGAVFRLGLGVSLSELDLFSDINMTVVFLSTAGQESFGRALLGMLLVSLALQMTVAYMQNRKKAKCEIAKELSYVVFGVSPGVFAYRVATGKTKLKTEEVDPKLLLAVTKLIEMFGEGSK
jgi:hypothetical protein